MNFVELMEFLRAFSAISFKDIGLKPKPQILYENRKGYCICFSERKCASQYLFSLERLVAPRGLNLEKRENYWIVWSPEDF
jgi:hypothetical protein